MIAFPGGYGGLVNTNGSRVTISCCIRRDTLMLIRKHHPLLTAGKAVMRHVTFYCRGEIRNRNKHSKLRLVQR
jgi:hypothetical protein